MDNTRYYQRNKERLREPARNKYRSLSEEDKIKRENTEKIDIIICLKKRSKNWKNMKNEDVKKQKSLEIINKTVF